MATNVARATAYSSMSRLDLQRGDLPAEDTFRANKQHTEKDPECRRELPSGGDGDQRNTLRQTQDEATDHCAWDAADPADNRSRDAFEYSCRSEIRV